MRFDVNRDAKTLYKACKGMGRKDTLFNNLLLKLIKLDLMFDFPMLLGRSVDLMYPRKHVYFIGPLYKTSQSDNRFFHNSKFNVITKIGQYSIEFDIKVKARRCMVHTI